MLEDTSRVLITGGAGFIGSSLCEALLARGCRVTALDDLSTGRVANLAAISGHRRFAFVQDSVTNEGVLDQLVRKSDLVFHLAAAVGVELIVRDPVHTLETNVLGTRAVLRAAQRGGAMVLLASTSEVYGRSERVPFREDGDRILGSTLGARWSYSSSKAMGEYLGLAYHRQWQVPVVIARLFNTIGPRQVGRYGMVVPRLVGQALRGERLTVYGDGRQTRCFLDVEDAVRALIGLIETPAAVGQVVNVGSTEELSILDLARRLLQLANGHEAPPDRRIRLVPYEEVFGSGFEDMRRRLPDVSKLHRLTGWRPRISFDQTLERILAANAACNARERTGGD